MSYAAKGEKVFSSQQEAGRNDPGAAPKRSDHRLKRFTSTLDKRAWHFCEEVRSSHFHDLMSGSQTSLSPDPCHRYVPLEDLIRILMAEKDELIRELQERLKNAENSAEKQTMQEQIAELTRELNKTRDMLRKAMHKLQNIDEIVNENKTLHCRLRCSEERVRYLEERKKRLECELADLRSRSQIQMDLEKAQQMLQVVNRERELSPKTDEAYLQCLASERDQLQEKVKSLEKELEESRKKEAEIEMLKKQSHSDSLDREEMSRENECYKKKLASMKCLEKQIQELKKQARSLADKYKREAQKAAEQMNKMCQASKELQGLREERDSLRKRVNELSSYECQYNKLVRKLQRVDAVIAENENLNCKVLALENLEKENDYLRCRLEAMQEVEVNAAEDKERIMQLQCAVADQEEEMKDLLCQIERLTSGRHEEELERLKCELYEKNSKLKLCEEQLAEIPMLEAEIDELRMKLQCCCKEFPEKKRGESGYQRVEVRFPATSTGIRAKYKSPGERCSSVIGIRREEKVEFEDKHASCQEILQSDSGRAYKVTSEFSQKKDMMSCEEVHNLLQSSKGIISCVLEDMIEHQKEMEELEICNRSMKEEIEMLKSKVGSSDKDSLLEEINRLKRALEEKEAEISRLQSSANVRDGEDVETIKELNRQMKAELEAACVGLKQVANLEKLLEKEREARCQAESRLRGEGGAGQIRSTGAAIGTRATGTAGATGATVAIRGTEATGTTVATRGTEATGTTVATRGTEATGTTVATRGTEATGATVATRGTEATGATVATRGTEATGATVATRGTEATGTTVATRGTEATGATGATGVVREAVKTEKGVEDDSDLDWCKTLQKETDDLKLQIEALNKLTGELKKENELLRELQQPCPDFSKELDEKCALENLLSLLQAELDAFKGQKLSDECEALRKELKRVMEQNCQLKALVDCYRQRLDLEKKSNELNQKRLGPPGDESLPKRSLLADGGGVEEKPKGQREREPATLTPSEILARERAEGRGTDKSVRESEGKEVAEIKSEEGRQRESEGKQVAERKSEEERERERLEKEKLEREKPEGEKSGEEEGEKERLQREKAEEEAKRLEEEAKKAEAKRLEEEAKKAEAKRLEEEAKKAEAKRLEEEAKKAEPKRLEEEKPPKEGKTEEAGKEAQAKGGKEKDNGCEEELKALRENMAQLKKENQNLQSALTDAEKKLSAAGKPDAVDKDLQKELEQLRKEKNDMAQQLAERPPAAGAPPDYEKELERLKNEKDNLAKLLAEKSAAGTQATAPSGLDDCLKELEKLKNEKDNLAKQLAEKSAAGTQATAPSGLDDCLKELEKLKKERDNLAKQLAEKSAAAAQPAAPSGQADLLKELEKLKNERDNLAKQLAEKSAAAAQPAAQPAAQSGLADCLKELEKLKNEKDNLAKQLAEKSAAAAQAADYLRELENLKNERKEWEKKLADATEKAAKEKADLQKELDQTKKEKGEMTQQPGAARAGGQADLQQAEADCAEKIKKLMEQHEKELANRDRLCNENLNAMKAGYEGDIRKLVDRHKQSIMRLQGLHEDEVQEMNLNYETQLETMQTQSQAAINDIAKGSAAKARKLEEQHAEDMKSMQGKYKNALEAKDAEYKDQIGGLRSSLTKSQQELEALRRQGNLADAEKMKAQQARELQKARRTSKQKLGAMKSKMEKEMRKSQEEIDALRQKLKEQAGSVCQCKYSRKPAKIRDPTCPLDFNEVLEKILEEGLDSLTFNEVALVHRKTCCALEGIVMRSNAGPVLELEPPVSDWCPHTPLLEADKQQLLSRIFDLENAILEKQRQTQDAIISMEVAIKKERCRLQEVRKTLQCEQQKNSELQQLLSSQTKLQTELRRERDQLGNQASMHQSLCREKSKQLDEEMKSKKYLEAEVEKLKNTLKQLCVSLDPERRVTDPKQGGPTELMRLKLEQSVREERRLALQLENEVKCRMQLQCQLQTLRQSLKHMVNLPAVETVKRCSQNPLDAKKVKERQNLDQINEKTNAIKTKFSKKQKK